MDKLEDATLDNPKAPVKLQKLSQVSGATYHGGLRLLNLAFI